ncbi:MAG: Ig-like domain-containing protein [Deltaproteobacteria bacterium]|nr:Ig-like domain-containing protein [Deltaproteobacteria bacterium]
MKSFKVKVNMRRFGFCLLLLSVLGLVACGNPEVAVPDALSVVFISVDGAADVKPDAVIEVFFSDPVDVQSATSKQIYLMHTGVVVGDGDLPACGSDWESQAISVNFADALNQKMQVEATTDMTAGRCYALVLTTAVRGSDTGPLDNLGLCDQASNNPNADLCAALEGAEAGTPPRVGAFAMFRIGE